MLTECWVSSTNSYGARSSSDLRNIPFLNHFDHGGTTPVILAYATSCPMCSLL